mgnify:CR=1 FL=1
MAGRNTSKELHPTKVGHMVQDVLITERDWQTLEELANCRFSSAQREAIVNELTVCRDYKNCLECDTVSMQTVKRTLAAISKMKPAKAIKAFNNCDEITERLIDKAALFQFKVNVLTSGDAILCGETIAKAAGAALDNLSETKGGRPPKSHQERLAEFCCKLWAECGNSCVAHTWEGNPSPMVEFAQMLFDLVDDDLTDISTIADRLNEAKKR